MQKGDERGQIGEADALTAARIFQAEAPHCRFAGRFLPDAQQVGVVSRWSDVHVLDRLPPMTP